MNTDTITKPAPSVISGASFFDPFEHVSELIKTPSLVQSVQSSLCWYADNAYVREIRNVFWTGFNDLADANGVDDYNDYIAKMAEREFAQHITFEQGFEVNTGPAVVRQLACLRAAWYDDMNAQEPMPSLEDLLHNEKAPRVNVIQHERLAMLAEHMSDDVEIRKHLVESLVARENAQAQFAHGNRQRMNPCLMMIASFCENTDTNTENFRFHQLPDPVQKRLIAAVPQILNNTVLRMSRDRKMSTLEYSTCVIEASKVVKSFGVVLSTPRWMRVEA